MKRKHAILLLGLVLPGVLLAAPDIPWYTIDGGGALSSGGGNLELSGTIGQPDASALSALTGGSFELTGGFWAVTLPSCTAFVPADFNRDCVVDSQDLVLFQACTTGPLVPYDASNLSPGCTLTPDGNSHIAADFDGDGSVDQKDFGVFQRCYSGPYVPPDPNCAD